MRRMAYENNDHACVLQDKIIATITATTTTTAALNNNDNNNNTHTVLLHCVVEDHLRVRTDGRVTGHQPRTNDIDDHVLAFDTAVEI